MNPRYAEWRQPEPVSRRECVRYLFGPSGRSLLTLYTFAFAVIPGLFLWIPITHQPSLNYREIGTALATGIALPLLLSLLLFAIVPSSVRRDRFLRRIVSSGASYGAVFVRRGGCEIGSDYGVFSVREGLLNFEGTKTDFTLSFQSTQDFRNVKSRERAFIFGLADSPLTVVLIPAAVPENAPKLSPEFIDWLGVIESWRFGAPRAASEAEVYPPRSPAASAWGGPKVLLVGGALLFLVGVLPFVLPTSIQAVSKDADLGKIVTTFASGSLGMIVAAGVWWRRLVLLRSKV